MHRVALRRPLARRHTKMTVFRCSNSTTRLTVCRRALQVSKQAALGASPTRSRLRQTGIVAASSIFSKCQASELQTNSTVSPTSSWRRAYHPRGSTRPSREAARPLLEATFRSCRAKGPLASLSSAAVWGLLTTTTLRATQMERIALA